MGSASTSDGSRYDSVHPLESQVIRAQNAARSAAGENRSYHTVWQHDYKDFVLVQPVEVNDAPFGDPFMGLAALADPQAVHLIVSIMPPTRFLHLTPAHDPPPHTPTIVDVHSCQPVRNWGFHVQGAVVSTQARCKNL